MNNLQIELRSGTVLQVSIGVDLGVLRKVGLLQGFDNPKGLMIAVVTLRNQIIIMKLTKKC